MQGYVDGTVIEAKGLIWVNSFVKQTTLRLRCPRCFWVFWSRFVSRLRQRDTSCDTFRLFLIIIFIHIFKDVIMVLIKGILFI